MLEVVAAHGAGLVMMHRLVAPEHDRWSTERDARREAYGDVVGAVAAWLAARVEAARAAGVAQHAIAVDPGFGFGKDVATFAIFRRHAESPTWRIEKEPALANRQGQYAVYGLGGQVLRRGRELRQVLRVFESRKFTIVR